MTEDISSRAPWRSRMAAIAAVVATYFYFLIFTEFAFLELARQVAPTAGNLRIIMVGLGLGGVSGAALAALAFRVERSAKLLAWAFRACAISGLLALGSANLTAMVITAAISGASLGALTVTLASMLRLAIGES